MSHNRAFRRLILALLAAALILAACTDDDGTETTSTTAAVTTSSTARATTTTAPDPFIYRVGLIEPPSTDNFWAFYDPQSSVVDQYLLGPTKPSIYTYHHPGLELAPDLAASADVPDPVESDDGTWTVTVELRGDARWSDGAPITSDDVVFTFETVRDFGLTRGWATAYPLADEGTGTLGLVGVEAPGRTTVVYRFNGEPGLPFWPNGPGTAPIMPRHHWEETVEAARTSSSPSGELLLASGAEDPSGGPFTITSFSEEQIVGAPNTRYHRSGDEITSGGVDYVLGPFFDEIRFEVQADQREALAALSDGSIDVILSPTGLDRLGAQFAEADTSLTAVSNETNSFRYLAFNLRRSPMSSRAFRDALDVMIDREFMVDQILQGEAFPLYTTVPPANPLWFNPDEAEAFAAETAGFSAEERLRTALATLEEGGFAWTRRPEFVDNVVQPGAGVTLDGEPVEPIQLLAPGSAFDPQRATYALWIEEWLEQLGFEVDVELKDFNGLVQQVFTPVAGGTDIDFDMYVLGWRLPSPGMPVYYGSFWAAENDTLRNGGNNNTGFNDDRFNAFVEEYNSTRDQEDAFDILWEMERILFEEKPYLVLFDTGITEAFRTDQVAYPFTQTLAGLQFLEGMPAMVAPVE